MTRVIWDKGFEKSYRQRIRILPVIKKDFFHALDLFAEDPFHPALRTHPLTGPLQGLGHSVARAISGCCFNLSGRTKCC